MKNYILPSAVVLMFTLSMCTEIEYRDVEKEIIKRDTITKYVDRIFQGTDTVTITQIVETPTPTRSQTDTVTVIQYDTLYQMRVDTVWRTQVVVDYDTVVVRELTYGDTLFITYGRGTQSIDPALWDMWLEFFQEAGRHGHQTYTGTMIVERVKMDAVQQAYSFVAYGQLFIKLNSNLTDDECMVPLWRELSRQRLGKEYSQDETKLLFPFFNAHTIRWSNRLEHKAELNEFF